MAAVDVSESEDSTKACAIKVIRRPILEDDEEDDESIDEEELAMYTEEFVLCTLKPGVIYQQTLNVSFSEGEAIFFTNTGDCDVHLTGNYMTPVDEPNGQDDYDSEDDEDSEDDLIDDMAAEDSDDDLDDIDARITELEEAEKVAKPSKKRRASAEADLDTVMDEAAETQTKPDKKLSKKERKKLKGANGEAAAAPVSLDEDNASEDSAKKSVSFSNDTKPAVKLIAGGVSIEDRKTGDGPACKNGSKVSVRYVGKLKNGKQFDSNTKGKPFSFKIGSGECIKGMETGVTGMRAGGERRVEIPAASAYGSQSLPGIPANSDLVFDIKLLKFT